MSTSLLERDESNKANQVSFLPSFLKQILSEDDRFSTIQLYCFLYLVLIVLLQKSERGSLSLQLLLQQLKEKRKHLHKWQLLACHLLHILHEQVHGRFPPLHTSTTGATSEPDWIDISRRLHLRGYSSVNAGASQTSAASSLTSLCTNSFLKAWMLLVLDPIFVNLLQCHYNQEQEGSETEWNKFGATKLLLRHCVDLILSRSLHLTHLSTLVLSLQPDATWLTLWKICIYCKLRERG